MAGLQLTNEFRVQAALTAAILLACIGAWAAKRAPAPVAAQEPCEKMSVVGGDSNGCHCTLRIEPED